MLLAPFNHEARTAGTGAAWHLPFSVNRDPLAGGLHSPIANSLM